VIETFIAENPKVASIIDNKTKSTNPLFNIYIAP